MRVVVYAPYGEAHKEVSLLYLVANYLAKNGADVSQMLCDGAVPTCSRDRIMEEEPGPFLCARCVAEQEQLISWSGLTALGVSREIAPEDVRTASRWILTVPKEDLARIEFRGVNLWSACKTELSARFEGRDPSALSHSEESVLRAFFIAYTRVAIASERFIKRVEPSLALVSSIRDPLSHAFVLQAKQVKLDTAVFSFDQRTSTVSIESLSTRKTYATSLVLDNIAAMRNDPRTWGPEITAIVHEALTFLGCAADRIV